MHGAGAHRRHQPGQVARVERGIAVEEADDLTVGGSQPGNAGCAVSLLGGPDDSRAETTGDSSGTVCGPVVHDDRAVPGRHPTQHPRQRRRLVEAGDDHVDETLRCNCVLHTSVSTRHGAAAVLRFAKRPPRLADRSSPVTSTNAPAAP